MIAVLFETFPAEGKREAYFELAAGLVPGLEQTEGFLSVERFQSVSNPGKILSLSFWKDEESVRRWRNTASHRVVQQAGRKGIFENYRLRVAGVLRDYGMNEREQAPADSKHFHEK